MIKLLKQLLGLIGIIFILFELYYHGYQKPHEEELIQDAKMIMLFMLTDGLNEALEENHDPNQVNYGEVS